MDASDVWAVFFICSIVACVVFTAVMGIGLITYLGSVLGLAAM